MGGSAPSSGAVLQLAEGNIFLNSLKAPARSGKAALIKPYAYYSWSGKSWWKARGDWEGFALITDNCVQKIALV